MAARSKRAERLSIALVVTLAIASAGLTYQLRESERGTASRAEEAAAHARLPEPSHQDADGYTYDRLSGPARTVVRDAAGAVVATLTDGARTAVLTGPSRTFAEPATTDARVVTDAWVRLLPRPWAADQRDAPWFPGWLAARRADRDPDILAMATQYLRGAPDLRDASGRRYAGQARFGPLNPRGAPGRDLRLEQSDFYQYLGRSWTFPDAPRTAPERARYGAVDCSGYIRLVYGYRAGYPLLGTDRRGVGLPRTADAMARVGPGRALLSDGGDPRSELGTLQPGDLVFFDIDRRSGSRLDHMGLYLGLDTEGHPRFLSSREENNGPTLGDVGGSARIDGGGFYARGLRAAKRL
ncbi:NlpC/P60 family protein [Streptomyces sp. NPDC057702]|uniref:NlpC/P60 family protein n=1 Tax=unclassified Streptomyces TaxID=2593676 RepID=UPI003692289E